MVDTVFWNVSGTDEFNAASADFSQDSLPGIQSPGVEGHLLDDGTFIFVWVSDGMRKMVQTTKDGTAIKSGFLRTSSDSWRNPSTWSNGYYSVKNFKGRDG